MMSVRRSIVGDALEISKSKLTHFQKNENAGRMFDIVQRHPGSHIAFVYTIENHKLVESQDISNVRPRTQCELQQNNNVQLRDIEVQRSILVSQLPKDALESELIIHFQSRRSGGGDVERIICLEEKDSTSVVVVFAETEDAKSVLEIKQRFRNKFQLTIGPIIVRNDVMKNGVNNEEVTIFESVTALLHPKLFEGLTEDEMTSIIEKVSENASVNWVPSDVGLLSTGTIYQLERARNVLEKEVARTRRNAVFLGRQNDCCDSHDTQPAVGAVGYGNKTSKRERKDKKANTKLEPTLNRTVNLVQKPDSKSEPSLNLEQKPHGNSTATKPDNKPGAKENLERSRNKIKKLQKSNAVHSPNNRTSSKVTITQAHETTESNSHSGLDSNCLSQSISQQPVSAGEKYFYKTAEVMKKNSEESWVVQNLPNKVFVRVIRGDLTNQLHTDVIVNPCNSNLQNTSGVGASIIDNGGLSIQTELNSTLENQDIVLPGNIIKTTPGTLPFQIIYHLVCPQWNSVYQERSSNILHVSCLKSLQEFSETGMRTIAYPTFSSSFFSMPEETCAHVMLNAVNVFAEKRDTNSSNAMNVHFVSNSDETLRVFQSELNALFATDASQKTKFTCKDDERSMQGKSKPTAIRRKKNYSETGPLTTAILYADEAIVDKCPVCLDNVRQPITLDKCQHTFCKSCVDRAFRVKKMCPLCKLSYAVVTGNQPDGKMSFIKESSSLPGFSESGTIVITCHFKGGYQGARHPNPGQRYSGITRVVYLPDNREGNDVLYLLRKAFDHRLLFQIGTASSCYNQITWGDIDLKTAKHGGPPNYGYPDADYLMRVKEQLATKGIYP